MKVPCTVIPSSRQSAANRRARSTRRPFLMLIRICWFPDSYPTSSSRSPLSLSTFSVSQGTLALALQDQVRPRWPSPRAIASARGRSSVNVSSSKNSSFTCGNSSRTSTASASTWSTLRVRYRWPPTVCGHRQNVHRDRHPRPVYSETYGCSR